MGSKRYFTEEKLLTPPTLRAAYSDRMAYVCAELSRLSYFRFEGGATAQRLLNILDEVLSNLKVDEELNQQIKTKLSENLSQEKLDEATSEELFSLILEGAKFKLIGTFSQGNTQGYVCTKNAASDGGKVAFLVYRGTDSIGDAIDDLNVKFTTKPFESGDKSKVHSGFNDQFVSVNTDVEALLAQVNDHQLFITGHSLGGALAVLATRFYICDTDDRFFIKEKEYRAFYKSKSNGACYTFGAPAVANPFFQHPIKTPIYRIVNSADPVARVPSAYTGFMVQFIIQFLYLILGKFDYKPSQKSAELISNLKQYRQNGYDCYLIRRNNELQLRSGSSLNFLDRVRMLYRKLKTKKMALKLGDFHRIDNYVDGLKNWANSRN